MFSDTKIISSYTREQAIEDGILIDVTSIFPQCSELYRCPVAITIGVWGVLEQAVNNPLHCNDLNGLIWDLLYMSIRGVIKRIDPTEHLFQVIITGAGLNKYHTFRAICGPGDAAEPVITIMLPGED